ncbi:MAG: hypothetical protein DIZ80_09395 [endosymbiont of Galathealinum brachiosum]|uniref:Lipoprotein n=1 Tax=endosymbiont of Galathealinum brachiosum TaxID=2200906 RepID=A0A370DC91_9GAMM|nr:MAG: hypothetical protein DIZ80_09395 [endosymbiont of Galathealinum brachiosum]
MSYKKYFLIFVLSMVLVSCGRNQWKSSEITEVFSTNIKPGGLKLFNYSLTKTASQASRRGSGKGSGNGSGMGGGRGGENGMHKGKAKSGDDASMKQYLYDMLKVKLEKSGYCREGYIELDSNIGRGWMKIRGECEEGATEKDRIKFINNKST